ncbi:TPA: ImmA/IrrE family metallo-endopeptidase [Streptococcus pyogenes]|uniref:ImmA/IrrE family metallo-endopeptidase n=1 Tax=Streptococcus lutetiensis TaxID=150055 RepID=UPI003DA29F48
MTINEIVKQYNIKLCEYPPSLWDRSGFYYAPLRTVYINSALSEKEKKKVIYHELGHLNHDTSQYDRRRELFEIQANRKMIQSILKEELSEYDEEEIKSFNYVRFMEKYDLITALDEELVKEEFLKLIG